MAGLFGSQAPRPVVPLAGGGGGVLSPFPSLAHNAPLPFTDSGPFSSTSLAVVSATDPFSSHPSAMPSSSEEEEQSGESSIDATSSSAHSDAPLSSFTLLPASTPTVPFSTSAFGSVVSGEGVDGDESLPESIQHRLAQSTSSPLVPAVEAQSPLVDLSREMAQWAVTLQSTAGDDGVVREGGNLSEEKRSAIGRWGEALAYQLLCYEEQRRQAAHPNTSPRTVRWLNQHVESGLPYDLVYGGEDEGEGQGTEYVEVKSTRHSVRQPFAISAAEVSCALVQRERYHIWRVCRVGGPDASIRKIANPAQAWHQQQLHVWMEL